MRLTPALLVIVDISGYTDFITNRETSLLHAEQIITELMESVIEGADHPLAVNKLEGDAALLFREFAQGEGPAAARDVLAQLGGFFTAFGARLGAIREQRRHCSCDACSNTARLCLKAFVHAGEIAVKRVGRFEELAGEHVILLHRLLKNSVPEREFVLLTEAARALAPDAVPGLRPHAEHADGVGDVACWLGRPGDLPTLAARTAGPAADATAAPFERQRTFHHLPEGATAPATTRGWRAWWSSLRRRWGGG